ncbi:MAG TPA: Rpn family recombination-promoting nuclease/putative transposase [Bacteroidetes bacterium]|nr:Rpn family recombination-promoting nuclease/putative transposase [Bacteroidota bacterium]
MEINNIHDKFFKSMLGNMTIAKEFISAFLPKKTLDVIDIDTLTYANTEYVFDDLKDVFSDMVFSCKLKENKEKDSYISIILEHKSYRDKFTAIQLLLYISYGYYTQYKNTKAIEPIIPLVFYHGKKGWHYKPIVELFNGLPKELKKYIPVFDTKFVDLGKFSDEQLERLGNAMLESMLLLQKYSTNPDKLADKLLLIYKKLDSVKDRNFIRTIVVYSLEIVKLKKVELILEELPKTLKKEVMTAYDTLIERGMQEGSTKKAIKVILNGYKKGLTIEFLSEITEIPIDEVKEILKKNGMLDS